MQQLEIDLKLLHVEYEKQLFLVVLSIFFRLIDHRFNRSLKNRFFSIFEIFNSI